MKRAILLFLTLAAVAFGQYADFSGNPVLTTTNNIPVARLSGTLPISQLPMLSTTSTIPNTAMIYNATTGITTLSGTVGGTAQGAGTGLVQSGTNLAVDFVVLTGTLSSGTASITNPYIFGAHPILMDTAPTLTSAGALSLIVSGSTASVKSNNILDASTFYIVVIKGL